MPVRPVLLRGDPRLRQPAQPWPAERIGQESLRRLVRDLLDTQTARSGAGLAAPQIGEPWRVVVVGSGAFNPRYPLAPVLPRQVLVNPSCTRLEPSTDLAEEGCLSVPELRAPVRRWRRVWCEALTPEGEALRMVMEGFAARVLQHEIDHLDGVLLPDRVALSEPARERPETEPRRSSGQPESSQRFSQPRSSDRPVPSPPSEPRRPLPGRQPLQPWSTP